MDGWLIFGLVVGFVGTRLCADEESFELLAECRCVYFLMFVSVLHGYSA